MTSGASVARLSSKPAAARTVLKQRSGRRLKSIAPTETQPETIERPPLRAGEVLEVRVAAITRDELQGFVVPRICRTDSRHTVRMASELEELRTALDRLRASVLRKLTGLSDVDARRSTVPSGTNLAGLVQHLTFVESLWFEEIVSGGSAGRGKRSMQVDQSVSLAALRSEYRAACAASNAIISSVGDADAPVTRAGKTHDLRWAILSVLEETARHAGHADIIREQIDGRTGRYGRLRRLN